MNAPDRLLDSAESLLKHHGEEARQYLIGRLHDGKTVHRLTLADLLHAELAGSRCEIASQEIVTLLLADSSARAAMADKFVEGVIERFLATHEELVMEAAEEMA